MNSIGIQEGTIIKGDQCTCIWKTLLSMPPQMLLTRKCNWCKQREKELADENKKDREQPNYYGGTGSDSGDFAT